MEAWIKTDTDTSHYGFALLDTLAALTLTGVIVMGVLYCTSSLLSRHQRRNRELEQRRLQTEWTQSDFNAAQCISTAIGSNLGLAACRRNKPKKAIVLLTAQ